MLTHREVPKINGSATAFIVLVVILVLIIIIACSATIYLLREDIAEDREALTSGARGRYHLPGSRDGPSKKSSKNWIMGILRFPGSHNQTSNVRPDKSGTTPGRSREGWFPAGNESDWDSLAPPSRSPKRFTPSATMRMTDQDTLSPGSPRSSNVGSFPHVSRMYSSPSNATSSVRFDPHGIRGLSCPEQTSLSTPGIISSFQSQLYSPTSSPSRSPIPGESSRTGLASPEPMERSLTNDSFGESFVTASESRPTIRTFEGGTKFIEAL